VGRTGTRDILAIVQRATRFVRQLGAIGALLWACTLASSALGRAQVEVPVELDAPWSDVAPRVDARGARVVCAAVGAADPRYGSLDARRLAARHTAQERARRAVHAWADEALATVHADPRVASAVHTAIDSRAEVTRVRPRADGSAVVEIAVPLAALRTAAPMTDLPWSSR
jgi:hypothetical protein